MVLKTSDRHQKEFQIDDDYYEVASYYDWFLYRGYPSTKVECRGNKWHTVYSLLFGPAEKGLEWDHINRDKLDNRRCNLRQVTRSKNVRNSPLRKDNPFGVKGVRQVQSRADLSKPWRWQIQVNHKYLFGYCATLQEAIACRKEAEKLLGYHED